MANRPFGFLNSVPQGPRLERAESRAQRLLQAPKRQFRSIVASSCSRLWQWYTNIPAA